jgi:hypothetical protein
LSEAKSGKSRGTAVPDVAALHPVTKEIEANLALVKAAGLKFN